ncbi:hypothetical protein Mapa_010700 [Marchantia paleacea]|nr:hypothetical protein Mapa_010700 [Marchantia paleacea]
MKWAQPVAVLASSSRKLLELLDFLWKRSLDVLERFSEKKLYTLEDLCWKLLIALENMVVPSELSPVLPSTPDNTGRTWTDSRDSLGRKPQDGLEIEAMEQLQRLDDLPEEPLDSLQSFQNRLHVAGGIPRRELPCIPDSPAAAVDKHEEDSGRNWQTLITHLQQVHI